MRNEPELVIAMEEEMTTETEELSDFSSLPEGVVATTLSLTAPSDICRASAVSRIFHSAAQSDIVWNRFLPADLADLISRTNSDDLDFDPISSSKKDVFFSLCDRPLLIDDGNVCFSLDKQSGKRCIMLGPRSLKIVWSENSSYWTWEHHPNSRFSEVAVLLLVWWLEIHGRISCRILSPRTTYAVYFVFSMKKSEHEGFNVHPSEAIVGILGTESHPKSVCLDPYLDRNPGRRRTPWDRRPSRNMAGIEKPIKRQDGWFETELGEFQSGGGDDEVEIALMEVKGGMTKTGLVVEGIEIRPKASSVVI